MIDISDFELDSFSVNPEVFYDGRRLCVSTTLLHSILGLGIGYRSLEVDPDNDYLRLYNRRYWLLNHSLRIDYDDISYFRLTKCFLDSVISSQSYNTVNSFGGAGQKQTVYTAYWRIYVILNDCGSQLPLFKWQAKLGIEKGHSGAIPHFDHNQKMDSSRQNCDFELAVKQLRKITGKEAKYD